jgi:hypothetical protein
MTTGGVGADAQELYTFATKARQRSGGVRTAITDATAVHLGQNVMGVVGGLYVGDAGASLAKIIGAMENTVAALTEDAEAASGAAADYESTEQQNTDTFKQMDTP